MVDLINFFFCFAVGISISFSFFFHPFDIGI